MSSSSIAEQLFADPLTPSGEGVAFLPRERLLSLAEQAIAMECFKQTLSAATFTSGPELDLFESALSEFLDIEHVVAVSSGTAGLEIGLRALGVRPGNEVIIPANSFAATENAILALGAIPVLADVSDRHFNLTAEEVEAKVTGRTRAIMPVHLYGRCADMPGIHDVAARHGLVVIEDACQAFGATGVGRFCEAAVLSFNPVKNFGLCGKGGAILIKDPALAERCRQLSYHGFAVGGKDTKVAQFGLNARLDNVSAAIGYGLLPYASLRNFKRIVLARRYLELLRPLEAAGHIQLPEDSFDTVWHLFAVQVLSSETRGSLRERLLESHGVETGLYYPVLAHKQPGGGAFRQEPQDLANTEKVASRILHLPLYQNLTFEEQDRIVEALECAFAREHFVP
jgi:3-dehydro-glucose-6-phosphate--glutamate transaminase